MLEFEMSKKQKALYIVQISDIFIYVLSFTLAMAINSFVQKYIAKKYNDNVFSNVLYIIVLIGIVVVISTFLFRLKITRQDKVERALKKTEKTLKNKIEIFMDKFFNRLENYQRGNT